MGDGPSDDLVVANYLGWLRHFARRLDRPQRVELVEEVAGHIRVARADGETVASILDGLGPPEQIVQAAAVRPPRTDLQRWYDVIAVALIAAGGLLLAYAGWCLGVILLWSGRRWTLRDRLIGTLVPPLGLSGAIALSPLWTQLSEQGLPAWFVTPLVVVYAAAGAATAWYLLRRAAATTA